MTLSARSPSSARRGSEPSRGFARPRPGRGLARVAMAFCLFAAANGQNVASESGTFVDVTPNVQTQLDGRFGTAPSHRSGHTMVRPPARPPARASRRPARRESWCSFRTSAKGRCSFWHATVFVSRKCVSRRVARAPALPFRPESALFFFDTSLSTATTLPRFISSVLRQTRVDEDTAVVFGGLGGRGTLNDVWEFRVAGANWTLLHAGAGAVATSAEPSSAAASLANAAPSPRVGHCAVVLRGDLYVFGGYDPTRGHTNDVWVFKRADGTWRPVSVADGSPFPSPRSGAGAVAPDPSGGTFVIFGGDGKDDVWAFDVDTGVWTMRQGESVAVTSGGRGASSASRARGAFLSAAMLFAFDAML